MPVLFFFCFGTGHPRPKPGPTGVVDFEIFWGYFAFVLATDPRCHPPLPCWALLWGGGLQPPNEWKRTRHVLVIFHSTFGTTVRSLNTLSFPFSGSLTEAESLCWRVFVALGRRAASLRQYVPARGPHCAVRLPRHTVCCTPRSRC